MKQTSNERMARRLRDDAERLDLQADAAEAAGNVKRRAELAEEAAACRRAADLIAGGVDGVGAWLSAGSPR